MAKGKTMTCNGRASSTRRLIYSTQLFLFHADNYDVLQAAIISKKLTMRKELNMAETEFQDQAKGFADALLAHRTASILEDAVSCKEQFQLIEVDMEVIKDALKTLLSCEAGLMATEQSKPVGEMGFLEWMDNLKHYETSLDAIVRAKLANKEKDVAKTLGKAKELLEKLLEQQVTGNIEQAIRFFNSMSEISLEAAVDTTVSPPQEMRHPEELSLGAL